MSTTGSQAWLTGRIGGGADSVAPAGLASHVDVVVVAIAWDGLTEALALAGPLTGRTVIDCTNPVDFGTGRLKLPTGSAAELVARTATGAHVVKALHLFAGAGWPYEGPRDEAPVVAICGDEPTALDRTTALIEDLGARATVIGGLTSARQLEETAGFVMRVVASGHDPRLAVPHVGHAR